MIIEELLGTVPKALFMEQYYLKLPFSRPGGCRHLLPLGSWTFVEHLLRQPGVDALAGREGQLWNGPSPPTPEQARGLLEDGYTLGIRHAERHAPELANLAAGFAREFAAPINIHVYCTPAGQPGFGWHYDAEDVFILQTAGSKGWSLRKNTVNPWPLVETIPQDMRYQRELMPLVRSDLAAGDWLYIPGGYWHRTEAGEDSISLSIGVMSPTAMDVFDFVRRRLLSSLRWRQRLPAIGDAQTLDEAELIAGYRELFGELGQDLARQLSQPEMVAQFLAERRETFQRNGPEPNHGR